MVLKRSQATSTRLGDVLVASGMVPRERLRTVVREQIVDSVAVPLAWTTGSWRFEEGESVVQDIPLGLGMQDTLMEAARRLGQIEVIQAHMGSMDTVVDFPQTGDEAKLSLKPDEWAMLTHIDGMTSVADIAERAGYTQLETARIIYGLLSAGVVVRVDPEAAAAEEEQRPPASSGLPTRHRATPRRPAPATPAAAEDPTAEGSTAGAGYLEELEGFGQLGTSPWAPAAAPPGGPAATDAAPGAARGPDHDEDDPARTAPHGVPSVPSDSDPRTAGSAASQDPTPRRRRGRMRSPFRRR